MPKVFRPFVFVAVLAALLVPVAVLPLAAAAGDEVAARGRVEEHGFQVAARHLIPINGHSVRAT